METIIDSIYRDNFALIQHLDEERQLSYRVIAENNFKKTLILSIASYFEKLIIDILIDFAGNVSNHNPLIVSFIEIKALKRQYHTLFDWEANNANKFFSNFGKDFKKQVNDDIVDDGKLEISIKSFLELGKMRNHLVHRNFAEYQIDKTAEEIYSDYKKSVYFIEYLQKKLV